MHPIETSVHDSAETCMLQLVADSAQSGSPVLPVRWCISRQMAEILHQRQGDMIGKPMIVITIVREVEGEDGLKKGREVARHLYPLDQFMAYVPFRSAGDHTLHATVLWASQRIGCDWKKIRANLFRKGWSGDYLHSFITYDGFFRGDDMSSSFYNRGHAQLSVTIDAKFFAKEPPEWLKWWVNLWHYDLPVDQCSFRRRMIGAFTVQPPLIALWIVFAAFSRTLGALVATSLGSRQVGWSAIVHPLRDSFNDIVRQEEWCIGRYGEANFAVTNRDGKERHLYGALLLSLPFYWSFVGLAGAGLWAIASKIQNVNVSLAGYADHSIKIALVYLGIVWGMTLHYLLVRAIVMIADAFFAWFCQTRAAGFILGVFAAFYVAILSGIWWVLREGVRRVPGGVGKSVRAIGWAIGWGSKTLDRGFDQAFRAYDKLFREPSAGPIPSPLPPELRAFRGVVCTGEPLKAQPAALPRVSLSIRYEQLKAKVCKPFAS